MIYSNGKLSKILTLKFIATLGLIASLSRREMWAKEVWEEKRQTMYDELDDTIPMGGSQPKIVVIDDELVFSGEWMYLPTAGIPVTAA